MLEDKEVYYSLIFDVLRFDKKGFSVAKKNQIAKKVEKVLDLKG